MVLPFRYRLREGEKDALLAEQAALIERLAARVKELEALLAKPKKTSQNSHMPPAQDRRPSGGGNEKNGKRRKSSTSIARNFYLSLRNAVTDFKAHP